MDLFEQPAMSYTSLRQETAIQSGLGQKASYYAVAAMFAPALPEVIAEEWHCAVLCGAVRVVIEDAS